MKKTLLLICAMLTIGACKEKEPEPWIPWHPEPKPEQTTTLDQSTRVLVIPDQRNNEIGEARITMVDQPTAKVAWEWNVAEESQLTTAQKAWFVLPDEAKPVYDGTCLLVTASRGGAMLMRISDKKILFFANPAGNPHSAELLPDGNIVVASSTGNTLKVYVYNPSKAYVASPAQTINVSDAHNVVWDAKRNCLWTASNNEILKFSYNGNRTAPELEQVASYALPGSNKNCHDLAPIYGEDALYVSSSTDVLRFDPQTHEFTSAGFRINVNVKSVSTGPEGFPIIVMRPTSTSYYSAEIVDKDGNSMYSRMSSWFYKGRWLVDCPFSNPDHIKEPKY